MDKDVREIDEQSAFIPRVDNAPTIVHRAKIFQIHRRILGKLTFE